MSEYEPEANEFSTVEKNWTIMVYMAGDNNLSEDMVTALKQMTCLAGDQNINLIVLYDSSYPSVPVKIYEFTKAPQNSSRSPRVEDFLCDLTPQNRPNRPQMESYWIKSFVPRVAERYPAKKYALILSGHSDGIIGKTILRDENPSVVLDTKKLKRILYKSRPKVNGKTRKFDLLGFDGCLMNMLEVSYELRDVARVMVASEGNIPTTGWDYSEVLKRLHEDSTMDEFQLASQIVDCFSEHNVDYTVSGRSVDITACNLRRVTEMENIAQRLGAALLGLLSLVPLNEEGNVDDKTKNNRFVREHFVDCILLAHYRSQAFMHNQAVDLVDFVLNLILESTKRLIEIDVIHTRSTGDMSLFDKIKSENGPLIKILEELLWVAYGIGKADDAADKPVSRRSRPFILSSCAVGAEYQFSKGTAVFFPWTTTALSMVYDRYADLDFNQNRNWIRMLEKRLDLTIRTSEEDPLLRFIKSNAQQKSLMLSPLTAIFGRLFSIDLENYANLAHREHGGKEHGGKEHGGKGELEAFYRYFSQFRHFDPDFFEKNCLP